MLTCIYRNQKKDLESKVTYAGKVSRNGTTVRHGVRAGPSAQVRLRQRESIASLNVALGRITAVALLVVGR